MYWNNFSCNGPPIFDRIVELFPYVNDIGAKLMLKTTLNVDQK